METVAAMIVPSLKSPFSLNNSLLPQVGTIAQLVSERRCMKIICQPFWGQNEMSHWENGVAVDLLGVLTAKLERSRRRPVPNY